MDCTRLNQCEREHGKFTTTLLAQETCYLKIIMLDPVQPADIGCPTGNGKKLSKSQACCLAQLCLAAAQFLSISNGQSCVRRLYMFSTVQ